MQHQQSRHSVRPAWSDANMRSVTLGESDDQRDLAVRQSGVLKRIRDPELASVVAFTAAQYRSSLAGLSIIMGRRQILLGAVGTDIQETSIEDSFCAVTIQRPGEPLIVPDATADGRFADFRTVTGQPYVRFYAGVSIVDRNGYALGALCIADPTPRTDPFDPTVLLIRAREIERLVRS